jgi:predicted class III extradiol MEMO1 family dioxygenase
VSSSLYSDAYLQKVIDTSELCILPLLVSYSSAVTDRQLNDNVATLTTNTPHNYIVGSTVVVAIGDAVFDGTKTVTRISSEYLFSFAKTNADITRNAVIPHGTTYLSGYDAATIYASNPAVYEAIIVVSVEVFQSINAAGGQIEGVDFQPTPYRMGRSLLNRVIGILGKSLDTDAMLA